MLGKLPLTSKTLPAQLVFIRIRWDLELQFKVDELAMVFLADPDGNVIGLVQDTPLEKQSCKYTNKNPLNSMC